MPITPTCLCQCVCLNSSCLPCLRSSGHTHTQRLLSVLSWTFFVHLQTFCFLSFSPSNQSQVPPPCLEFDFISSPLNLGFVLYLLGTGSLLLSTPWLNDSGGDFSSSSTSLLFSLWSCSLAVIMNPYVVLWPHGQKWRLCSDKCNVSDKWSPRHWVLGLCESRYIPIRLQFKPSIWTPVGHAAHSGHFHILLLHHASSSFSTLMESEKVRFFSPFFFLPTFL